MKDLGSAPIRNPATIKDLLRRPDINISALFPLAPWLSELVPEVAEEIETEVKYEGYLARQAEQVARFKKLENVRLPDDLNYEGLPGLSREVQEKLNRVRPVSMGQASRISGVTPAAMAVIQVLLKKREAHRRK